MAASWGADTLAGGPGDGWNSTNNAAAYQNASNLPLHVTGFHTSDITTFSSVPFNRALWTLDVSEPASATLPTAMCEMPTRFAYLPALGFAVPRIASPNVGAADTTPQTAAILRAGAQANRNNTQSPTCH